MERFLKLTLSQTFSRARFDEDFFLDQAVLRRIKRHKQLQEQQEREEEEEDGDGEGDSELMVRGHKQVPGRVPKRERA